VTGRFIVFEGLDGAGTSTQAGLLAPWLQQRGLDVETTREPSNGAFGRLIRRILAGEVAAGPAALALAFATDRVDHVEGAGGVRESLEAGRWVISDRYVLSSIAYQGSDGLDVEWLHAINARALAPDLTIFIDTDPDVCMERILARGGSPERFEGLGRLKATLRQYRVAIEDGRFIGTLLEVDGNASREAVFAQICAGLTPWLARQPQA
jgi:dTMP kinase